MSEIVQQPLTEGALPPARRRSATGRRILRWTLRVVGVVAGLLVLALLAAGGWAWWTLSGSKPQLEGEAVVSALAAPVVVERDARGVPLVRGESRADVAAALGFLHAQERFFQMDLLRRQAAGEMAAMIGPPVVDLDRRFRRHRLRSRAAAVLAAASPEERELLERYSAGVNEGLSSLDKAPFEYLLLGATPEPWKAEDSVLVLYAMFLLLQDEEGHYDEVLGALEDGLPAEMLRFLTPRGGPWDAPVAGEPYPAPVPPGPEVMDLRELPRAAHRDGETAATTAAAPPVAASNAWALSGQRTADGRALLAIDMHLQLMVPNLWYRAAWEWPRDGGQSQRVVGVTVPGVPLMVVGSNGAVAWGFTNGRADTTDLVELEAGQEPGTYRSADGDRPLRRVREVLEVRGGDPVELVVEESEWGPVVGGTEGEPLRAVRWVAHDPEAAGFGLLAIETCGGVECALAVGQRSGVPAMNLVVADSEGHIGWTVAGKVPRRVGTDGRYPIDEETGAGWNGWLSGDEVPAVVDPASGSLWSGNNRMVGGEALDRLGDGNYTIGARAGQARDRLLTMRDARPADLLELQLDDRALFLAPWQRLLSETLAEAGRDDEPWREMRRLVDDWGGRATPESVGYVLVREFREQVAQRAFAPLLAGVEGLEPDFDLLSEHPRSEAAVWSLLERRPPHLLDPRWEDWDALLVAAAEGVLAGDGEDEVPLAERTWGRQNTLSVAHLFAGALPVGRGLLAYPAEPLPGDELMPRVQGPDYGASQRMVVAPGAEEEGIFHMPGGQSGHPLARHFRTDHEAWARGEAAPLLPGEARHVLTLRPRAAP